MDFSTDGLCREVTVDFHLIVSGGLLGGGGGGIEVRLIQFCELIKLKYLMLQYVPVCVLVQC